jgi:hypothetical protein
MELGSFPRLYFTDGRSEEDKTPPDPDRRTLQLAKSNRARRGEKFEMTWIDGEGALEDDKHCDNAGYGHVARFIRSQAAGSAMTRIIASHLARGPSTVDYSRGDLRSSKRV